MCIFICMFLFTAYLFDNFTRRIKLGVARLNVTQPYERVGILTAAFKDQIADHK